MATEFRRVMLIDDDDINNFYCTEIISELKFSQTADAYTSARKGLEALGDSLRSAPDLLPEIIFLDLNMPVMNGWDFIREYRVLQREMDHRIPIIILSSSVYERDKERAGQMPEVVEFISKPLSEETLAYIKKQYLPVSA